MSAKRKGWLLSCWFLLARRLRTVDWDWSYAAPYIVMRHNRAIRADHLSGILTLNCVFGADLPPTIRTVQCGRPVAQQKFATEEDFSSHTTPHAIVEMESCGCSDRTHSQRVQLWIAGLSDAPASPALRSARILRLDRDSPGQKRMRRQAPLAVSVVVVL